MISIDFMPMTGKKDKKNFTDTVAAGRNESRAYKALFDMITLNEAIEHDTQALLAASARGEVIDKELLAKLITVKEKYLIAIKGIQVFDDQQEHLALIIYGDAVQDVIDHLKKQKKH